MEPLEPIHRPGLHVSALPGRGHRHVLWPYLLVRRIDWRAWPGRGGRPVGGDCRVSAPRSISSRTATSVGYGDVNDGIGRLIAAMKQRPRCGFSARYPKLPRTGEEDLVSDPQHRLRDGLMRSSQFHMVFRTTDYWPRCARSRMPHSIAFDPARQHLVVFGELRTIHDLLSAAAAGGGRY